tara:strand:+ start:1838 stop:2248 length:411 start_codon:yes stop_codon:yes gene_type:complete
MEVFKANYGSSALIMFVALMGVFSYAFFNLKHWYFYAFYPFIIYLLPYIENSRIKYQITAKELVIEKIFNKKIIPKNRIRRVEILENKKWIQFLNGKPERYITIKYNKLDETNVFPENPEKFRDLLLNCKEQQNGL